MAVTIGKRALSLMVSFSAFFIKIILIVPKGTCRYYPSCTEYAQEAVEKLPFWKAVIKISGRIIKCNPLFKGGYDPVERF
jgi:putative membrane protein insertion efficiency factor